MYFSSIQSLFLGLKKFKLVRFSVFVVLYTFSLHEIVKSQQKLNWIKKIYTNIKTWDCQGCIPDVSNPKQSKMRIAHKKLI